MTVLSAQSLRRVHPLTPFYDTKHLQNGKSYGCSSAGYDIRVKQGCIMWPGRFWLASSIERFNMPDDIQAHVCDKSSWIRDGISVHNTVIEPGWEGHLTLEIKNISWKFRRIRPGDPIAQIVFDWLDYPTDTPYRGKYQRQDDRPIPAIHEGDYNGT